MIFLRIESEPPRSFYVSPLALPLLPASEAREELLLTVGALRSSADGETPNLNITLRNTSAQCSKLFADPPIGAKAELRNEDGVLFAGVVSSVDLGEDCRLSIEA